MPNREIRLRELLDRPGDQRLREYRYRFSQSIIFGLPVIALEFFGRALGPADSERWVSLLQPLLAGWVVYVNLGMFFEGLLMPARHRGDLLIATIAIGLYIFSVVSAVHGIVTGRLWYHPLLFHICVIILAIWTGIQWRRASRTVAG